MTNMEQSVPQLSNVGVQLNIYSGYVFYIVQVHLYHILIGWLCQVKL